MEEGNQSMQEPHTTITTLHSFMGIQILQTLAHNYHRLPAE
jgi:hypothetical protein